MFEDGDILPLPQDVASNQGASFARAYLISAIHASAVTGSGSEISSAVSSQCPDHREVCLRRCRSGEGLLLLSTKGC
jgi:hypothetical protein